MHESLLVWQFGCLQVDAAINSGNSGGPAFNKKGAGHWATMGGDAGHGTWDMMVHIVLCVGAGRCVGPVGGKSGDLVAADWALRNKQSACTWERAANEAHGECRGIDMHGLPAVFQIESFAPAGHGLHAVLQGSAWG